MWQDDEDNNPYGSFTHQDPANPVLNATCEICKHRRWERVETDNRV